MDILVAYGTTEGHTRKIAEFSGRRIEELGHYAELLDLNLSEVQANVVSYDKIIVAGSVHQKRHQDAVGAFILANRKTLEEKPALFLSTSLSAAFEEGQAEAQGYVDNFLEYLEWSPTATLLVAGALKYDEYDFFKSQIIEHVVLKGRDLDDPKGDHDFTDWSEVAETVDGFVGS